MDNLKPIAVISGASSGIGKQISIKLAALNYKVILISRNKDKLLSIQESLKKNNQECQIIVADISKANILDKLKNQIKFPNQVNVLINNAGIGIFDRIQDISIDDWNKQIDTNLRGSFLLSKFFVPFMIDNKFGKILFMNSVAGLAPYPYATAYVASKYALRGFSASLREELRDDNIKVISIHPGAVNTPLWEKAGSEFPTKDMMSSNDVADLTIQTIIAPNNVVCEEIVIRRTAGDFK